MAEPRPIAHDKVPEMPWGLHLISDATSGARQGEVAVDIIAVHGLGANPDHAWVRHKDVAAGLEKDVRWLTDLLPQTFRDYQPSISARIFCFNYQSAWLGPQLIRNRLENVATRLLDGIQSMRSKNGALSDRPLIFIGHSFGGLVIEQAVVQANSAGSRYERLVNLIGGVVLLGTPHQGSKVQKWGSIVANLARLIDYGEVRLMEEVEEKSMKILDMISEFMKTMIRMDLAKTAVICFFENLRTDYSSRVTKSWGLQGKTSIMVVEEDSAVLSGCDSVVLDSDHLKLNKFTGVEDGNYMSVSSNLCRIAAEAPEITRRRRNEKDPSSHFLVSRERVKDFIGRHSLLDQIRLHFSGDQTGPPPTLILHALGGQGKSQIALEYCRKWRETYRGVFWIDANSEMTATQSYAMIAAELMGKPLIEKGDSAAQIRMVKDRLEQWGGEWLLVFDNYDEPDKFSEIRQFIPTRRNGHVLFTSRNRDLSRLGTLLEIPAMATEEGVQLLLRGYNDNDIQQIHKDMASSIINRFGKLALAIDQAAAYITYKRMPLDRLGDFLITYETERHRILSYTPKKFWEYRKMHNPEEVENISAFTTWEMSFRQLGSGDEPWKRDAAHFLTLSAFFAPTSIAESLFRKYQERQDGKAKWVQIFSVADGVEDDGDDGDNEDNTNEDDKDEDEKHEDDEDEYMERVDASEQSSGHGFHSTWDTDRFWDLIAKSNELSLLQSISPGTDQEGAKFSLHPLIRDWLQLRIEAKERQKYTQEAIEVLACSMEAYDDRSVTLEERTALLTHMDVSMSNDGKFSKSRDRLGHNIANCSAAELFAKFYYNQGRYRTSEELSRRVVETRRSLLGEKHPFTLNTMNSFAVVLRNQGKYEEAEVMHRQVLKLRETELGDKHSDTLLSMNNLAVVLRDQGKYEEAEVMHRQVLKLRETELGDKHSDTLLSMNNLAVVLRDQGKDEEAEVMHRQVLKLRETELGDKHADTLRSMNNLAIVLAHQGNHEEAERLCRQALMLQETVLGKEHPDTLSSMRNLAWILHSQNKDDEAEWISRQALLLQETVKGKEHPNTLWTMQSLAEILRAQGKLEEAERICRETLMLRETVLGKEHPDTLWTMQNLAEILRAQGKHEEAEQIFPENANDEGDEGDVGDGGEWETEEEGEEGEDVGEGGEWETEEEGEEGEESDRGEGEERGEDDESDEIGEEESERYEMLKGYKPNRKRGHAPPHAVEPTMKHKLKFRWRRSPPARWSERSGPSV